MTVVPASFVLVVCLGIGVCAQGQPFRPDRPHPTVGGEMSEVVSVRMLAQHPPADVLKLIKKAQQLSDRSRHAQAIAVLQSALAKSPDYLVAHNMLGVEYDKLDQNESAAHEFEAMTKADPAGAIGFTNLAVEYCKSYHFHDAEMVARHALQVEPTYGQGHFVLAMSLLLGLGSVKEARTHLIDAARTVPRAEEALAILDPPKTAGN